MVAGGTPHWARTCADLFGRLKLKAAVNKRLQLASGRSAWIEIGRNVYSRPCAPPADVVFGGRVVRPGLPVIGSQEAPKGQELDRLEVGIAGLHVGEVDQDGPAAEKPALQLGDGDLPGRQSCARRRGLPPRRRPRPGPSSRAPSGGC